MYFSVIGKNICFKNQGKNKKMIKLFKHSFTKEYIKYGTTRKEH